MIYKIRHTQPELQYCRTYEKKFKTEKEVFDYISEVNERQSYCYGNKDHFIDCQLNNTYNQWRSNLTISEYKNLIK